MNRDKLPEIVISARDMARLDIIKGLIAAYRTPIKEVLARELRRARIASSLALPSDTVSMHSEVRYRDAATGTARTATLVYPGEEDGKPERVSVLSPVGTALIGLSAGQSISYQDADGTEKELTVLAVLRQPEAELRALALVDAGRPASP